MRLSVSPVAGHAIAGQPKVNADREPADGAWFTGKFRTLEFGLSKMTSESQEPTSDETPAVNEEEVKGDLLKAQNVDDDVDGVDCIDDAQNARA